MADNSIANGQSGILVLTGAVALLAAPSAVLGLSLGFDPAAVRAKAQTALGDGTLARDEARAVMLRSLSRPERGGNLFNVTPGRGGAPDGRAITVAVRVAQETARAIQTRSVADAAGTSTQARMSQTAYNLIGARMRKSPTEDLVPDRTAVQPLSDLASFQLTPGVRDKPSRFSPRVQIEEQQKAGRAPRTFDGEGEATVDLGGSYSLSNSVAVTAGVRYSQAQRDRLVPVTQGREDEQAVYVGTRLKF